MFGVLLQSRALLSHPPTRNIEEQCARSSCDVYDELTYNIMMTLVLHKGQESVAIVKRTGQTVYITRCNDKRHYVKSTAFHRFC